MAIEWIVAAASILAASCIYRESSDSRQRQSVRRGALSACIKLFDEVNQSLAPDGYPRVTGYVGSQRVRLTLVPDTLVLRRLPQLWLSVTIKAPKSLPNLVLTARPRGEDYVSRRSPAAEVVDVPPWLPQDMQISGDDAGSRMVVRARPFLEALFADPQTKEVAMTPGRLDILYRVREGRRGAHLLLRQADFRGEVDPDVVVRLVELASQISGLADEPEPEPEPEPESGARMAA